MFFEEEKKTKEHAIWVEEEEEENDDDAEIFFLPDEKPTDKPNDERFVITLDPGLVQMGIVVLQGGVVLLATTQRLIGDDVPTQQWLKGATKSGKILGEFYKSQTTFFQNLKKTVPIIDYKNTLLVLEDNDNRYTKFFSPLAAGVFLNQEGANPEKVRLVNPLTVWNVMRPRLQTFLNIPNKRNISRSDKKKMTVEYCKKKFPEISQLPVTDHVCDALLNYQFCLEKELL